MRNERELKGRLHAYDQHLNMILGEVTFISYIGVVVVIMCLNVYCIRIRYNHRMTKSVIFSVKLGASFQSNALIRSSCP